MFLHFKTRVGKPGEDFNRMKDLRELFWGLSIHHTA
jgi:hypothetical protein